MDVVGIMHKRRSGVFCFSQALRNASASAYGSY